MTVASTTSKVTYTGNGSTRQWPFKFTVLNTDHLKVIITDPDGAETTLTDGYEISLTQGVVQYPKKASDPALKSGYKITLIRETPIVQNVDLINQGNYDAETLEREYDYLTLCVQEVADKAERAVKIPASSDTDPDELINSISESVSTAKSAADSATASAESASNSADQAGTSASAAATSEANAATSETNAKAQADNAAASAAAAKTSETNAKSSETAAADSATAAGSSASAASASQTAAAASAAAALASQNAAQTAENSAAASASAAAGSATNAAQSAQEAAASAANAANKVDSVILTNATQTAAGYMSAEDKTKLDALIVHNTLLPVGTVMWLSGNTVPDGCLVADGAAVSRTTYAELFAVIGTTWGEGDGNTTFNLPDGRGRVPEGAQTAGGYNAPGLPNITGSVGMHSAPSGTNIHRVNGAFYPEKTLPSYRDGGNLGGTAPSLPSFTLDASRSSSIYGASSTVQPASVKLLPVIVYRNAQ